MRNTDSTTAERIARNQLTLMIKPVGAMCNLRCTYCYYLPTLDQWGGHERRMSLETLEHLFAGYLPSAGPRVTIAWQGGEPTLAGLDFFRQALEIQKRYTRPGQQVDNAIQTNGTLLDNLWGRFLQDNRILVGLSLDGPGHFHDHYRQTRDRRGSSGRVLDALKLLRDHQIEFNVLCVLNDRNVYQPDELLGYFLNLGIHWLQFIPAIEWIQDPAGGQPRLAPFSPDGKAYGRFLCRLFDRWFERYRHQLSIRIFDDVLVKLVRDQDSFCILAKACHSQLTVEHDGSVFGCDHFVEPRWQLGRIENDHWLDEIAAGRLETFARRKPHLPAKCQQCQWRPFCHGGCPKHRLHRGQTPEPTTLCAGYQMFFHHAMGRLQWMADYLKRGEHPPPPWVIGPAPGPSEHSSAVPSRPIAKQRSAAARNAPCPCGSGRKYKQCHGRS